MPRDLYFPIDNRYRTVATEDELLDFANEVRRVGGADILSALLPAWPTLPSQCLIAKALNFSCIVDGIEDERWPSGAFKWVMRPEVAPELAAKIASSLGLEYRLKAADSYGHAPHIIVLPEHIGNAALAFDQDVAFQGFVKRH